MTVPPALLSHETTDHYTPQYILDEVIACMGAIDLDPSQQQPRDPERAGSDALHSSGQRSCSAVGGTGLSQSTIRARCRAVVLEVIPGAVCRPDHGGNCVVEIGDRDRCMEDADGDIVSGVLSFREDPVCGAHWI